MLSNPNLFSADPSGFRPSVAGTQYQLAYKSEQGNTYCSACASRIPESVRGCEVNWHDQALSCCSCGAPIAPVF